MLEMKFFQVLVLATVILTAVSEDASNNEIIEIRGMSSTTLGSGVNASDLPMVKCVFRREYPSNTTCQIVIRNGSRCTTTYFTEKPTYVVSPYQLPGNKVLLHVRQSLKGPYEISIKENLTLIDMNSCERLYNVSLSERAKQVIPYEDGHYDVVFIRERMFNADFLIEHYFDASGQKFGEPLNISLGWENMEIQPVSTKSNSQGFLVRGNPALGNAPTGIKLITSSEGSEPKDVLELNSRNQLISHVDDDKYYTVCGRSSESREKVLCKRLDLQTNKVLEVEIDWDKYDGLRHVRASDSGIVLFGVQEADYLVEKLVVAEVRSGGQTIVRKLDLPWSNESIKDNCKIRDFNGVDRSFTLACQINYPKRGVALHSFDLPSKA